MADKFIIAVRLLKEHIIKLFTKRGLTNKETDRLIEILDILGIDLDDFFNYVDNVVYDFKNDNIDIICYKVRSF